MEIGDGDWRLEIGDGDSGQHSQLWTTTLLPVIMSHSMTDYKLTTNKCIFFVR